MSFLGRAGVAAAGAATGVAGWLAVNRAAVRRYSRDSDGAAPGPPGLPGDARVRRVEMSDGWGLRVIESGPPDGQPVVLLHGITLAAAIWAYQLQDLADAGLRVIAVDMRGHGGSGGAEPSGGEGPGAPDVTLDRMAADVADLLDGLDLRRAVVVGHSMGGMVLLRLMRLHPAVAAGRGRIAGLVLASTTSNPSRARGIPGLADLMALVQPLLASGSGLAARLPGPTLPANDLAFLLARITFGPSPAPAQVKFTGQLTADVPVRVSAALLLEIVRFDEHAVLPTIEVPATVVVGDHDLMTPEAQGRYLAARLPHAELEVLAGCGHIVMLERPKELNAAIRAVVARVAARR